jgi:hypothetical protein
LRKYLQLSSDRQKKSWKERKIKVDNDLKVWRQGYASGVLAMFHALQVSPIKEVLIWVEYDFKPNFVDEKAEIVINVHTEGIPLPPGCDSLPGGVG